MAMIRAGISFSALLNEAIGGRSMDIVFLAIGAAFFALSLAYIIACEKL
jgi:hypothetical protein